MTAHDLETSHDLCVGDHVWASANPRPNSVHWIITAIYQAAPGKVYASLSSPMSGMSRISPIESLTLHSRGKEKTK